MPKSKPAQRQPTDLDDLIVSYHRSQRAKASIEELQTERRDKIIRLLRRKRATSYTTPDGIPASIVVSENSIWHIEKLRKELDAPRFKALCPPAPNGKALKAILVSDPVLSKKLARCRDVEHATSLRVGAAD